MTGEEYWKLNRGDTVKVINSVGYDSLKVGDILIMEFMSQMNEHVYFRNTRNNEVCMLDTFAVLSSLSMTDEEPADKKVINLPFAVNDKVWFITNDEVHQGNIIGYTVTYSPAVRNPYPCINYILEFKYSGGDIQDITIHSSKCFSTKEELLKSL